jgi:hypothetical protein
MPANITHVTYTYMTCRPMSSTCCQSPCHRSENLWCPTAGWCWRECLLTHQRCQLDNHQIEGKGGWNYHIKFVAYWTGYDRRFEILCGMLMWCHWVNCCCCWEWLQHSSLTAWCCRWRRCGVSKFSELVTDWCSVASQKAQIWTEYIDHLHTDNNNCLDLVIAGLMSHI